MTGLLEIRKRKMEVGKSGGAVEFDGGGVAEGVEDAEHQVGGDGVENGNGKMEITRLMTWSANGPRCGGWDLRSRCALSSRMRRRCII